MDISNFQCAWRRVTNVADVLETAEGPVATRPGREKTCAPKSTVIIWVQLSDDIYHLVYIRTQLLGISELDIKFKLPILDSCF